VLFDKSNRAIKANSFHTDSISGKLHTHTVHYFRLVKGHRGKR